MKFKIGFTIDAQTLFGMMAKMLPIEDVSVEEIAERAIPKIAHAPPQRLAHAKPKKRYGGTKGLGARGPNLKAGANRVIMEWLADGKPHAPIELKPRYAKAGFARTGLSARLAKLKEFGVVTQPEIGLYQLAEAYRETAP